MMNRTVAAAVAIPVVIVMLVALPGCKSPSKEFVLGVEDAWSKTLAPEHDKLLDGALAAQDLARAVKAVLDDPATPASIKDALASKLAAFQNVGLDRYDAPGRMEIRKGLARELTALVKAGRRAAGLDK